MLNHRNELEIKHKTKRDVIRAVWLVRDFPSGYQFHGIDQRLLISQKMDLSKSAPVSSALLSEYKSVEAEPKRSSRPTISSSRSRSVDRERSNDHVTYSPLTSTSLHNERESSLTLFTWPFSFIQLILLIYYEVQAIYTIYSIHYSFLAVPVGITIVYFLLFYFQLMEHERMKMQGHINFFRETMMIIKLPFILSGFFSVILLLIITFPLNNYFSFSLFTICGVIASTQNLFVLLVIIYYLFYVYHYNFSEVSKPDKSNEQNTILDSSKKISFLEQLIKDLSKKLNEVNANDEKNNLDDISHLIATKDQEMRTLTSERDHLRVELDKLNQLCELLRKNITALVSEGDEIATKITSLGRKESKVMKETSRISVLLDVAKQSKEDAQRTIDDLRKAIDKMGANI